MSIWSLSSADFRFLALSDPTTMLAAAAGAKGAMPVSLRRFLVGGVPKAAAAFAAAPAAFAAALVPVFF